MTDLPLVATRESDPDLTCRPDFALSLWSTDDGESVDMVIHTKPDASTTEPASLALVQGVVMIALETQGVIASAAAEMFPDGPPTEAAAVEFLELLLKDNANDQPV